MDIRGGEGRKSHFSEKGGGKQSKRREAEGSLKSVGLHIIRGQGAENPGVNRVGLGVEPDRSTSYQERR